MRYCLFAALAVFLWTAPASAEQGVGGLSYTTMAARKGETPQHMKYQSFRSDADIAAEKENTAKSQQEEEAADRVWKKYKALAAGEYKEGDEEQFQLHGQTTDKLLLFASDGRFYTLPCDKIPRGKGFGEPVRLMIDMENDVDIVAMHIYQEGSKLLLASTNGKGFVVDAGDVVAQTKSGKQILNLPEGEQAVVCCIAEGDHVATVAQEVLIRRRDG